MREKEEVRGGEKKEGREDARLTMIGHPCGCLRSNIQISAERKIR